MVDADGHITMTGFGYAKVLGIGPDAYIKETITHFRMEEYQAPEMHLGWVHDFSVDCWAFGILIYVMLFGRVRISRLSFQNLFNGSRSIRSTPSRIRMNLRTWPL